MRKPLLGKKLLVASIGVATVTYVACGSTTSGNLMPPIPDKDSGSDATDERAVVGNLMPAPTDATPSDVAVSDVVVNDVVGNLIAPPQDASGKD